MKDSSADNKSSKAVAVKRVKRIGVTGEFIKLDALLKYAAIVQTGGEAKIIIQNGDVTIAGEPCTQRGKKLRDGDIVKVGNETLVIKSRVLV
jgi:ribosome-associated protein